MLALLALLGASPAQAAAPNDFPTTLLAGLSGGLGVGDPAGAYGLGFGRLMIHTRGPLSADVGAGEGYGSGPGRELGEISIGVRGWFTPTWYVRGGFLHHHEVLAADFVDDVGGAIAGVGEKIIHRSGADLAVGGLFNLEGVHHSLSRWSSGVELGLSWLPGTAGPPVYLGLSWVNALHVGPRRDPR